MKYKIFLIAISILVIRSCCQEILHDLSFRQFCEYAVAGKYKPRENDMSISGDLCDIEFKMAVKDDIEANRFCRKWVPYGIKKAESKDGKTNCIAEATLVCPSGKTQIHGNCYAYLRNEDELQTYEKAEAACKAKGAEIATLHRADLPRLWNAFFKKMYQIWVNIPEGFSPDVGYENGHRAAIAYGSAIMYRAKFGSLVKVGNEAVSSVLCQWKPEKMGAMQLREIEALKEIWYHSVKHDDRVLISINNRYGHMNFPNQWQTDACRRALKPLHSKFTQAAFGDMSPFKTLFEKEIVVARAAAYRWEELAEQRRMSGCGRLSTDIGRISEKYTLQVTARNDTFVRLSTERDQWDEKNLKSEHFDECDQFFSSAHVPRSDTVKYWTMSDAFRAPLLCYISYAPKRVIVEEPEPWKKFIRETGEIVWHAYIGGTTEFSDRFYYCGERNALASGFESEEELKLLTKLCKKERCWLGALRKEECRAHNGVDYDDNPSGECSLKKVFQWENGVARNGNASVISDHLINYTNGRFLEYPRYEYYCLAILRDAGKVEDYPCSRRYDLKDLYNGVLCQKPGRTIIV